MNEIEKARRKLSEEARRRAGCSYASAEPEKIQKFRIGLGAQIQFLIDRRDDAGTGDHGAFPDLRNSREYFGAAIRNLETAGMYAIKALYMSGYGDE